MILSPQHKHLEYVRYYVIVNVFIVYTVLDYFEFFWKKLSFFKNSIGLINVLKLQNNNYTGSRYE